MRVEDLLIYGKGYCHSDHVKFLLADLLNLNPLELLNHLNDYVNEEKIELFKKEINSLANGKPLQYVIGNVNFYGNKFIINENVLIPRFETEELVENTIILIKKYFKGNIKIIDLGCGSGNIGITLKKELPESDVTLIDISKEAIKIAKENALLNNVDVNIYQSDMLNNVKDKYDIVISNPPYISYDEPIEDIVKNNEPHQALYAENNGLYFYEEIIKNIEQNTKDKYLLAFEIGYKQQQDIIDLINKYLKNVKIFTKKDLQNRDRMIFVIKDE